VKPLFSMREALSDPLLLGNVLEGTSWAGWRTLLIASMGEKLTAPERRIFKQLTGRTREPLRRIDELWCSIGRRGGKTRAAATLAVYLSALCDHRDKLSLGERGLCLFLAQNQRQAQIAFDYTSAVFESVPMLQGMVRNKTADTLSLTNNIDLEVRPSRFRTLRGVTCVACIVDEIAFFYSELDSANADSEILTSLRPTLSTTSGPLVAISSPYAKKGELYATWKKHYGPDGDKAILVAQGSSRTLNPSLPQAVVDRAMERDAAAARGEYLAIFRDDLTDYVSPEVVQQCVDVGCYERSPQPGQTGVAFVDPAGGSGQDSMTLAVAHLEGGDTVIIDALRERKPRFSPTDVVEEFCELLKSFRISTIVGDKWGGEFCREPFRAKEVFYKVCERAKSDLYRDALPLLNSGKVRLLDNARLVNQLCGLERRTGTTGRDIIDHPLRGHDDLANAVAGVIVTCAQKFRRYELSPVGVPRVYQDGVQIPSKPPLAPPRYASTAYQPGLRLDDIQWLTDEDLRNELVQNKR
jgi:hypothetical protein